MHLVGRRLGTFNNALGWLHHPCRVAHPLTIRSLPARSPRIISASRSIATQQTSDVHYIRLPNSRKGRKAAKKATDYWKAQWKIINQQDPPRLERDLHFFIYANPSRTTSILCPESIVFARNDPLGQRLWRIANPIPWSKRPRIIRWPVYGFAVYYGGLFLSWLYCHEEEPVTGRWRLKWASQSKIAKLNQLQRQFFSAAMQAAEESATPDSYPMNQLMRSVLDRLTAAAGLDDIEWEFQFVNEPGKVL